MFYDCLTVTWMMFFFLHKLTKEGEFIRGEVRREGWGGVRWEEGGVRREGGVR